MRTSDCLDSYSADDENKVKHLHTWRSCNFMSQTIGDKKTFPDLVRVKVWIIYDHGICCVEVDTNTTSTSGKQVYEIFRIWFIELIHALLPGCLFGFAVLEKGSVNTNSKVDNAQV